MSRLPILEGISVVRKVNRNVCVKRRNHARAATTMKKKQAAASRNDAVCFLICDTYYYNDCTYQLPNYRLRGWECLLVVLYHVSSGGNWLLPRPSISLVMLTWL